MRIGCLFIPELPLVAALRGEPALASAPLAVVQADGKGQGLTSRARVLGATLAAEGVQAGQTLAEAQALCPDLRVRAASPEQQGAAAQAALDAASSISPRIEQAMPGLVFLDLEGLEALLGDEAQTARALLQAAERVGLCAAVGVAEGRLAARLAARTAALRCEPRATRHGVGGGALCCIPREEQPAFLAGLSLASVLGDAASLLPALEPREVKELWRTCQRFGLATLGELARLPVGPLSERLGAHGAMLHRLARGDDRTPLLPLPAPERFAEAEELEWALGALEPLLFLSKSLLDRLCARLSVRGLAARALRCSLRLESGAWDERAIELAAPSLEVPPLLQLLKLELAARPPAQGVCAVRLEAVTSAAAREQLPLFGPRLPGEAQLSAALARIEALVGPGRVGEPTSPDRHASLPFAVQGFAPPKLSEARLAQLSISQISVTDEAACLSLSLRALRPPRSAEVRCDESGHPRLLISEGALGGPIVSWAGPWRTEAEWWTEAPIALDSYDLELAGGLLVRAAHELANDRWWIEALYD